MPPDDAVRDRPADPPPARRPCPGGWLRGLGGGIVTGAAADDPSAIGTCASAGAAFGLAFLWIAPVLPPLLFLMMRMSNDPAVLGRRTNGRLVSALGWITTGVTFAATGCLVATWVW